MIFYEVSFLIVNFIIAYIHSRLILHNKPIVHWLWAAGYFLIMGFAFWFTKSWVLIGASLLIRELIFAQVLNLIRKKKFFYINTESGSVIDKIEGNAYRFIWFGSLAAFVATQFILFKKPRND